MNDKKSQYIALFDDKPYRHKLFSSKSMLRAIKQDIRLHIES